MVDIRGGEFFDDLYGTFVNFDEKGIQYKILFLDADNDTLLRRFSETRRIHPLAEGSSNAEAIELERDILNPIKKEADYVINTSDLKPSELAQEIRDIFGEGEKEQEVQITIQSFGFKYGLPREMDTVFDVRFIPNPFYISELKRKTGDDKDVQDYVMSFEDARYFKERVVEGIIKLIPAFKREGKFTHNISFGCTGGQHRSVTMANIVYNELKTNGVNVKLKHRDL